MIGYAADERARWISGASDVELTRSLEEEHIRRWKGVERIV